MTFKHVKFEDSAVMRSLEKMAKEKGLVKPEQIQKTASSKSIDMTPTSNLMDNVLKLCAGLRSKGLSKYAEELEVNLLNYKKAQTLYEVSKEKGEDLIEFAHPKGSHKLEGVEGNEAVVEDILDRHLKMVDVVNKKPTGKLSNAQAIGAIRVVLGQEDPSAQLLEKINGGAKKIIATLDKIKEIVNEQESSAVLVNAAISSVTRSLENRPLTLDIVSSAKKWFNDRFYYANPNNTLTLGHAMSPETWALIADDIQGINQEFDNIKTNISARIKMKYEKPATPIGPPAPSATELKNSDPVVVRATTIINDLTSYINIINTSNEFTKEDKAFIPKIQSNLDYVKKQLETYSAFPENEKKLYAQRIANMLGKAEAFEKSVKTWMES